MMRSANPTLTATIYTATATILLILGLVDFRGVGEILLLSAIIFGGLSWYWIDKARKPGMNI